MLDQWNFTKAYMPCNDLLTLAQFKASLTKCLYKSWILCNNTVPENIFDLWQEYMVLAVDIKCGCKTHKNTKGSLQTEPFWVILLTHGNATCWALWKNTCTLYRAQQKHNVQQILQHLSNKCHKNLSSFPWGQRIRHLVRGACWHGFLCTYTRHINWKLSLVTHCMLGYSATVAPLQQCNRINWCKRWWWESFVRYHRTNIISLSWLEGKSTILFTATHSKSLQGWLGLLIKKQLWFRICSVVTVLFEDVFSA